MNIENKLRKNIIFFVWKLRGLNIKKLYYELVEREYWTEEQWEKFQQIQLQSFVSHCYENVEYYRELFDSLNINPEDIKSLSDLNKIPVLTKEIIRNKHDKIIAENYKHLKLNKVHTTGSTGTPLTIYSSKTRREYLTAGLWRIYNRCGWQPGERIGAIWGLKEKEILTPKWKKSIHDYLNGITRLNAWKANDEDFAEWYRLLKKQKATLIVCYASTGSRFANWLIGNGLELERVKGVYCTSEKMFEEQKEKIEQAFKCNVYDLYGCGEVNHIACTCEKGKMHINPDMVIIEHGQPDDSGQIPLVVTGLRNMAMPFLRYENGDAGKLSIEKCSCGRHSPLMELKVSRLADTFKFANGKKYPSLYFVLRLYKSGFDGIELFQFHQDKLDRILLRIVKNNKFDLETENKLNKVVLEIEEHIGHQAKVDLIYTDYIEQSTTSKHYYAKSDIK